PIGTGFLAHGRGMEDRLEPLHVSWGYHPGRYPLSEFTPGKSNPDARDPFGSTPRTRFLEFEGTRDICAWLAVPAATDFQAELGWGRIRQRFEELAHHTRQRMGEIGLSLATPNVEGLHGSMTAFELPQGTDAVKLRRDLWAARVEVPV